MPETDEPGKPRVDPRYQGALDRYKDSKAAVRAGTKKSEFFLFLWMHEGKMQLWLWVGWKASQQCVLAWVSCFLASGKRWR